MLYGRYILKEGAHTRMNDSAENFDIVFEKIAEATEETYSIRGFDLPTEMEEIAELQRFAAALTDRQGLSYTLS